MNIRNEEYSQFPAYNTAEFNLAIEQGLKRAPFERAKAVKDFFRWFSKAG